MKGSLAALCTFLFAGWTLAAPVVILDKLASQAGSASTHVRPITTTTTTTQQKEILSKPKHILGLLASPRVSIEKHPVIIIAEDGQRIQLPDHLAGAKAWETPNVLHFLNSLTRPKKHSPFPDSSIMREETRANTADPEPQESIVELETKAERESWVYIPYMSQDKVLRFHCVRKAADKAMLMVPLSILFVSLFALTWSALRYTFYTPSASKEGAIRLEQEKMLFMEPRLEDACPPYSHQPASTI